MMQWSIHGECGYSCNEQRHGERGRKLQQLLFGRYGELLLQNESRPAAPGFYTDGIKLVCEGPPVMEKLPNLENKGVRLIICSTCLNYFDPTEKARVGIVGGMGDILDRR